LVREAQALPERLQLLEELPQGGEMGNSFADFPGPQALADALEKGERVAPVGVRIADVGVVGGQQPVQQALLAGLQVLLQAAEQPFLKREQGPRDEVGQRIIGRQLQPVLVQKQHQVVKDRRRLEVLAAQAYSLLVQPLRRGRVEPAYAQLLADELLVGVVPGIGVAQRVKVGGPQPQLPGYVRHIGRVVAGGHVEALANLEVAQLQEEPDAVGRGQHSDQVNIGPCRHGKDPRLLGRWHQRGLLVKLALFAQVNPQVRGHRGDKNRWT